MKRYHKLAVALDTPLSSALKIYVYTDKDAEHSLLLQENAE